MSLVLAPAPAVSAVLPVLPLQGLGVPEQAVQVAATLAEVGAAPDLTAALEALLRGAARLLAVPHALARTFDPQTGEREFELVLRPGGRLENRVAPGRVPYRGFADLLRGGSGPIVVHDYDADDPAVPRGFIDLAAVREDGLRSALHVPITAGDRVVGNLSLNHLTPGYFGSDDVAVASALCALAGAAIQRARLDAAHRASEAARSRNEARLAEMTQRLQRQANDLQVALEDLKAAQERVIEQERLRALGQMAAGVAHDLNNTLAPVLGFSELLLSEGDELSPVQRERLRLIHQGARDAAGVVARLREFYRARGDEDTLEVIDAAGLLTQVAALTRPRWRDETQAAGVTVDVRLDVSPDVPPVAANAAELREALTNLVFNAVDAMPHGGTITLRAFKADDALAAVSPHAGTGAASDVASGAAAVVVLEVVDTGEGMPEGVRRRCLEPFFTTKGERGTGLGLAMVYGTATRHGGRLEIESAPGQGTTVRLWLARAQEPLPAGEAMAVEASHPPSTGATAYQGLAPARPRLEPAPGGTAPLVCREAAMADTRRVLVVDDDPSVRTVTAALLAKDGHRVAQAACGAEALDLLEQGAAVGEPFDLLLTDRAMPGMCGERLGVLAKQRQPGLPVVLLTGFGELMNAAGDPPAGIDTVIGKPVTLARLRGALEAVTTASST